MRNHRIAPTRCHAKKNVISLKRQQSLPCFLRQLPVSKLKKGAVNVKKSNFYHKSFLS